MACLNNRGGGRKYINIYITRTLTHPHAHARAPRDTHALLFGPSSTSPFPACPARSHLGASRARTEPSSVIKPTFFSFFFFGKGRSPVKTNIQTNCIAGGVIDINGGGLPSPLAGCFSEAGEQLLRLPRARRRRWRAEREAGDHPVTPHQHP